MRITLRLAAVTVAATLATTLATTLAAVPAAFATQDAPQGCVVAPGSGSFDYDAYIAGRKAQLSLQRAAAPWLS
jgi:hypothetical protein